MIDRTCEKSNAFQAHLADQYDRIIKKIQKAPVEGVYERKLFKDIANHLKSEKAIRRN